MKADERGLSDSTIESIVSAQTAAVESATEATRRIGLIEERLEAAASVSVGQTPSEVVHSENKLDLLHYEPLTEDQFDVPILIVYALINRPFILDLQPDRSVVRRLLEAGHDVYLIDWGEPSRLDQTLGLEDYISRYIDRCVDVVSERSGQPAVNVLGYCMGGTMSAIYAALHPEKVNAIGLLATGLYFEESGGVLEMWGDEEHFDPRSLIETYGNVPGEFLDVGFAMMDPVSNFVTKYVDLFDRLENEDFVRNFARMERWIHDSVDVAGVAFAEFVEALYQENRLYENRLTIGGEAVDASNIDMPMLQIVGEYDHLVPPTSSTPFNGVVGSDEVTTIEYPSGHVGLAVSTSAHRDVWPEVAEWFAEHTGRPTLADVIGEGVEEAVGVDVETVLGVGNADELEIALADADGEIARAVIAREASAIERFLEETLGVEIGLDIGPAGIAVRVVSGDGTVTTTIVEDVGEAIRTEVEEAIDRVNLADTFDLEDVGGIGPTYAGRLREAGIESVSQLAVADANRVAAVAEASERMARDWIERAHELVGVVG